MTVTSYILSQALVTLQLCHFPCPKVLFEQLFTILSETVETIIWYFIFIWCVVLVKLSSCIGLKINRWPSGQYWVKAAWRIQQLGTSHHVSVQPLRRDRTDHIATPRELREVQYIDIVKGALYSSWRSWLNTFCFKYYIHLINLWLLNVF